ncbi:MAG: cation:proton antiporter [Spirochaetes bacterium]|jgi:Kef-type K+ transport system membrane component KefB|nr:cation:proton antiporter [Spirochaetota bacterium]
MLEIFTIATVWLGLAVVSTILANRLKISMALMEICVGALAGYIVSRFADPEILHPNSEWIKFVSGSGAILLTFLAGAELDPESLKVKMKEVSVVGLLGFLAPFLGCTVLAYYVLSWDVRASLLAGVALSTTSMAVVYAVMLEYGFNKTEYGKGILGACFINDLGTVIALGLIFAPFNWKTLVFIVVCVAVVFVMPPLTARLTRMYGNRTAAIRTKWIVLVLFALGTLALWAGSEAVLPAYIVGMILAGTVSRDEFFIRRLRTLTIGFLTPIYFLRAGFLVSIPAIFAAPLVFLALLAGKVASKIFGLYPVIGRFRESKKERWYYTLLMSTGLTFGSISALYGLNHGIVSQDQYSFLIAAIIASAVVPTLIANMAFLPEHLLKAPMADEEVPQLDTISDTWEDSGLDDYLKSKKER